MLSKKIILLVDDEKLITDNLQEQISGAFGNEFLLEAAESVAEAWELIDEFIEDDLQILLIISDCLMPGVKGDEFLIQVQQRFPKIAKIMLTGFAEHEAIERAKTQANLIYCLTKPWNRNELIGYVKQINNANH